MFEFDQGIVKNLLKDNVDFKRMFDKHRMLDLQLEESYKQILARFPDIRMSGDWKVAPNNFVHAIQEMPVKF